MKSITLNLLTILSLLSVVTYSAVNYWNLPEVHTDSKNNCVRVINHSGSKYDCENMPTKFINYIVRA